MSINLVASMVVGKRETVNILNPDENESWVSFRRAEFTFNSVRDFITVVKRLFLMDHPHPNLLMNERDREAVRLSTFLQEPRVMCFTWPWVASPNMVGIH